MGDIRDVVIKLRRSIAATFAVEAGQGLSEYALILGLVAIVAVVALQLLGTNISSLLNSVAEGL